MASSKSVPRLMQPQPRHRRESDTDRQRRERQPSDGSWRHPGGAPHKGDLRSQVEAGKPSREREVGDLEHEEREAHGRA